MRTTKLTLAAGYLSRQKNQLSFIFKIILNHPISVKKSISRGEIISCSRIINKQLIVYT